MKRLILSIFLVLLFATSSFATDYYGCKAASNITGDDVWCSTTDSSCHSVDTPISWSTVNSSGNNLYANGCAFTVANGNTWNLGTGKLSTEAGVGSGGGSFTFASAATVTATSNIVAGTTSGIVLGGGGSVTTITGNITGGTAASAYGVTMSSGSFILSGNVLGGGNATGHGILGSSGAITISGNVTGGSVAAGSYGIYQTSTGNISVNGIISGGSAAGAEGIRNTNATAVTTITGSLVYTQYAAPVTGKTIFNPSDATKYITVYRTDAGVTNFYEETARNIDPTEAKVVTGTSYKIGNVTKNGSYVPAGGGAWAQ